MPARGFPVSWFALGVSAVALSVSALPASAQLHVGAGTTAVVQPGDAECVTEIDVRNDSSDANATKLQQCDAGRLKSLFDAGKPAQPDTVDLTASTRYVKQFRVDTASGAPGPSFLPVFISIPVSWRGVLINDSAVPAVGPLDQVGANVDVNMYARLVEGHAADPSFRVRTLEAERFMGVSHAGISGCLSVPKTKVQAAKMVAKCVVDVFQRDEGSGTVYLSAVIETGKTYNIELESITDLFSFNAGPNGGRVSPPTPGGHPVANFANNAFTSDPFGLSWSAPIRITVGTDARGDIQGLIDQITQLRTDLDVLRHQFLTHSHEYLTGKGAGHNDVKATTGSPIVK